MKNVNGCIKIKQVIKVISIVAFYLLCFQYVVYSQRPVSIAGGVLNELALCGGSLYTWGQGEHGEKGDGTLNIVQINPPFKIPSLSNVVAIDGGGESSFAVLADGTMYGWGDNVYGGVGCGYTGQRSVPTKVLGINTAVSVAASNNTTAALLSDSTVWTWGWDDKGQLGNGGANTNISTPAQLSGLTGIVSISAQFNHMHAVKSDGTLWGWGVNDIGQLGDGSILDRNVPTQATGINTAIDVAAGASHVIVLLSNGTIVGFGQNGNGQIGDGTQINRTSASPVVGINTAVAIAAGGNASLALLADSTVMVWGSNLYGQLANGTVNVPARSVLPVLIPGLTDVVEIAAGWDHFLAKLSDGTIVTWGYNSHGQMGPNGTMGTHSATPLIVPINKVPISVSPSSKTICGGDSVVLTATGASNYTWSPATGLSATTGAVVVAKPTATITYTVSAECARDTFVVITVGSTTTANAGTDKTICEGDTAILTATSGGTYEWDTGETTDTITVVPNATTTYTVTVTLNGCTGTDEVIVNVNALPNANAGPDIPVCNGSVATLVASGGVLYEWSTGETTDTITVNPTVITTYTVTVTDINGCSNTDEVVVTIGTNITANAGVDTSLCLGDSVLLMASVGGINGTYAWNTGGNTANIWVTPIITTTYTVTATDSSGCTGTDEIVVTVNPLPTANAGADITICNGNDTTLTANGGTSYVWNTGYSTAMITVAPLITSTYTVTATDASGCTDADEIIVTVIASLPTPEVADEVICEYDNTVTFTVINPNPSYTYEWYDSLTGGTHLHTGTTYTITNPQPPQTVFIQATDVYGCTSTRDSATVILGLQPVADFSVDTFAFEKQQIQFIDESTGADNWHWDFGDGQYSTDKNPKHAYDVEGIYTVTLIVCSSVNPYCCDTIIKTMNIAKKTIVLVPTTFTPNGDGDNDVLYVKGEGIEKLTFKIYNQWGLLIFESDNQLDGWDGKFEDNPQPEGNYVYILEAQTIDGQDVHLQGVVSLVR